MPEKSKKDRQIYVPPPRREESSQPETINTKSRLDVKLEIKKDKVVHAWEKEENKKVIHAWEVADESSFKLPPKPKLEKDQNPAEQLWKGNHPPKSKQSFRKNSKNGSKEFVPFKSASSKSTSSKSERSKSELKDSSVTSQEKPPAVTFVNAKEYLDQMTTSDWNDLEELDYTKVPKWNH